MRTVVDECVMKTWKVLARHKWVVGATITESVGVYDNNRRFTATIRGFQSWRIWQGPGEKNPGGNEIQRRVIRIRNRIDANDESVFAEKGAW